MSDNNNQNQGKNKGGGGGGKAPDGMNYGMSASAAKLRTGGKLQDAFFDLGAEALGNMAWIGMTALASRGLRAGFDILFDTKFSEVKEAPTAEALNKENMWRQLKEASNDPQLNAIMTNFAKGNLGLAEKPKDQQS